MFDKFRFDILPFEDVDPICVCHGKLVTIKCFDKNLLSLKIETCNCPQMTSYKPKVE